MKHQQSSHRGHEVAHSHPHGGESDADLARLLDLDAAVLGSRLHEIVSWVAEKAPPSVRHIADLGAGTGTGSVELAHRFPGAEVIAIDRSESMLERVRAAAHFRGLSGRVRGVRADVDAEWPPIGRVDIVWAASVLHEFAHPDRVLRQAYEVVKPAGTLAVVELDTLPRFLPDDIGIGRPGLESRCHAAVPNAARDWQSDLESVGFTNLDRRRFVLDTAPDPDDLRRYAHAYLNRIRGFLDDRLDAEDLAVLDRLLSRDGSDSLLRRDDLTVRGSRVAWVARRP